MLTYERILIGTIVLHVVYFSLEGSKWFYHIMSLHQGINLQLSYDHSTALPPMIIGTCMCLSFVLLVNKSHYWLLWKDKTETFVVKIFVAVQEKSLYRENSCLLCER